jgi:hypothetical protein
MPPGGQIDAQTYVSVFAPWAYFREES